MREVNGMIIVGEKKVSRLKQFFCRHKWRKQLVGGLVVEWKPHQTIKEINVPIAKETVICTKCKKKSKEKYKGVNALLKQIDELLRTLEKEANKEKEEKWVQKNKTRTRNGEKIKEKIHKKEKQIIIKKTEKK